MPLGQVGLCRTGGFWGWLIRLVTRSEINHVVVGIGDGLCISAEPGGVRTRPINYWPPITWSKFPLTGSQRTRVAMYAESQIGTPYDYLADAAIGVALITGEHTPAWLANYLQSDDRWQCAALADACLRRGAGENYFMDHRPTSAVYPGSFQKVFEEFGWMK